MADIAELKAQFQRIQNNYVVALASCSLLSSSGAEEHLRVSHCVFGSFSTDFGQILAPLKDPRSWNEDGIFRDFFLVQYRALLRDAFEVTQTYAHRTRQIQRFRSWEYYHFARLLRDALAHNFRWKLTDDLKHLPYEWRGRKIVHELDGHPLALDFLGFDGAWEFFKDMKNWAQSELD